ncbi:TetR/AcrR family transcriptional regulator [Mucilaginibacter angelicae]|uniref:TetR/AcrR family transcriptional regulator n=1 Tax=Mucilaginibacter angelicae TaxID=869718 RepID=A0ABV6L371_9SPHI
MKLYKMRNRDTEKENLVKQKAIEFLVTEGFEGFTVSKLAKICGISIATLYIYYKDKDDLIVQIAREEITKMRIAILQGFDPMAGFEEGLRIQWKNRYEYLMKNPVVSLLLEQLRTSSYQDQIYTGFRDDYHDSINRFMENVVARGEISAMPLELYWSVAFSPLVTLIRAHHEGQRPGGKPFKFTEAILWQCFDFVVKGLKI